MIYSYNCIDCGEKYNISNDRERVVKTASQAAYQS